MTAVGSNTLHHYTNVGGGAAGCTALGDSALYGSINGTRNTAIGWMAMLENVSGGYNTATGVHAGHYINGSNNSAYGYVALSGSIANADSNSSSYNCAFGDFALAKLSKGNRNCAFGASALQANVYSSSNIAIGSNALQSYNPTTHPQLGTSNTAVGYYALSSTVSGGTNTAIGENALKKTLGSFSVAVGANALSKDVGTGSLYNTGIGTNALLNIISGQTNTALGAYALLTTTSGSGNVGIGYQAAVTNATGSNQLSIQNVIYGIGMDNNTSAKVGIGNFSAASGNSPTERLDIYGKLRIRDVPTNSTSVTNYLYVDAGVVKQAPLPSGSGGGGITSTCSAQYRIPKVSTTGITDLTCSQIYDNGTNVGVRVYSPTANLHVDGTVRLENLPQNPTGENKHYVLIDDDGNLYIGNGLLSRPAISSGNTELQTKVTSLEAELKDLRSLVELMMDCKTKASTKEFTVFPNPAKNQIRIEPNNKVKNVNAQYAEIRDMNNKVVIDKTSFKNIANISLNNRLVSGSYLVVIYENGKAIQSDKIEVLK